MNLRAGEGRTEELDGNGPQKMVPLSRDGDAVVFNRRQHPRLNRMSQWPLTPQFLVLILPFDPSSFYLQQGIPKGGGGKKWS